MNWQAAERTVFLLTAITVFLGMPATLVGFAEYVPYASKEYVRNEVRPFKDLLISKLVSDNNTEINRLEDQQDSLKIQLQEKQVSPAERINIERRIKRSEQVVKTLQQQNINLNRCGQTDCQ